MTGISRVQLASLLAASSLAVMAATVVAPALPAMREHYSYLPNVSMLVALVLTLPGLVVAVFSPFMGLVADLFGRTRLLVIGLALFVISGVSGFFLDSLNYILLGRLLMGTAVACIMTTASALLIDYTEGTERQRVIGLQTAAAGIGGLIFPLLAGILSQCGWRSVFLVYLLPIILVPLAWLHVKDAFEPAQAPLGLLAEFPIGRGVVSYSLAFVGMIAMYAIPLQIPYVLAEIGHFSAVAVGFEIGITALSGAGCSLLFGRMRARSSPVTLIAVSFGSVSIGYLMVTWSSGVAAVTASLVLAGAGFGINLSNLTSLLQTSMPISLRGRAAGGLTSAISLGQFLSTFVYSVITSEHGAGSAFLFASLVSALIAVGAALTLVAGKAWALHTAWKPDP